jgi:hypothetical protein
MKKWLLVVFVFALSLPGVVKGQGCAVCTKTAAGLGEKSAKGLNSGILYLAILPLGIMGALGYKWWRHNK